MSNKKHGNSSTTKFKLLCCIFFSACVIIEGFIYKKSPNWKFDDFGSLSNNSGSK